MTNFFPAVGFLMSLLPEDRRKFLAHAAGNKDLMSNRKVYDYFAKEWNLPEAVGEDPDAELAGARLALATAQRIVEKYLPVLDETLTKMPKDLHDELEREAKGS